MKNIRWKVLLIMDKISDITTQFANVSFRHVFKAKNKKVDELSKEVILLHKGVLSIAPRVSLACRATVVRPLSERGRGINSPRRSWG